MSERARGARALPRLLAVALTLVVVALGGFVIGRSTRGPGVAEDSVEVGFVRDMAAHHAQAVAMAETIRSRTAEPDLVVFATDIALTQQGQIGQMRGWLEQWGRPLTSLDPPMAWAGHAMSAMPGMAASADLAGLTSLPRAEAEVSFLRLMAAHHRGGIAMADLLVTFDVRDEVERLAARVVATQTAELEVIDALLAARGEPPSAS